MTAFEKILHQAWERSAMRLVSYVWPEIFPTRNELTRHATGADLSEN